MERRLRACALAALLVPLAQPAAAQDRVALADMKTTFEKSLRAPVASRGFGLDEAACGRTGTVRIDGQATLLKSYQQLLETIREIERGAVEGEPLFGDAAAFARLLGRIANREDEVGNLLAASNPSTPGAGVAGARGAMMAEAGGPHGDLCLAGRKEHRRRRGDKTSVRRLRGVPLPIARHRRRLHPMVRRCRPHDRAHIRLDGPRDTYLAIVP
mgnify:CR=1 FL=1